MAKYIVQVNSCSTVQRTHHVTVEADSTAEAGDLALEQMWDEGVQSFNTADSMSSSVALIVEDR